MPDEEPCADLPSFDETDPPQSAEHLDNFWFGLVERLNSGVVAETRVDLGSPESVQVNRSHLLDQWENLNVRAEGGTLILELAETGLDTDHLLDDE